MHGVFCRVDVRRSSRIVAVCMRWLRLHGGRRLNYSSSLAELTQVQYTCTLPNMVLVLLASPEYPFVVYTVAVLYFFKLKKSSQIPP